MIPSWCKNRTAAPSVSLAISWSAITAASLLLMLAIVQVSRLDQSLRQSNERLRRASELLRYMEQRLSAKAI